jgi:hypothetical protein
LLLDHFAWFLQRQALKPISFCAWSAYFSCYWLSKAICQTFIHNGNISIFWKSLSCHKMNEFKICIFTDIPANFIVIKIHVRIKISYFYGLKSWEIGSMLNLIFGESNIIFLTTRILD